MTATKEEWPIYYNIVFNADAVSPALAAALNGEFAHLKVPIMEARPTAGDTLLSGISWRAD